MHVIGEWMRNQHCQILEQIAKDENEQTPQQEKLEQLAKKIRYMDAIAAVVTSAAPTIAIIYDRALR
jgi:hypothetical protein